MSDTLREWIFDRWLPQNLKCRSPKTVKQYQHAVDDFEKFLDRPAVLDDLSDETLAAFMKYLLGPRHICARTTNERSGRIKTFWRWAFHKGYVKTYPTLAPVPVPQRLPQAWREDQLVRLFNACRAQRGDIGGVPAWRFWTCLHAWLWATGERIEATLLMEVEHLRLDEGWAVLPATIRKGGQQPRAYRLKPEIIEMLRMILPPHAPHRERVFPWPTSVQNFYSRYDRLLRFARLPHDRYSKFHRMRVSRASWLKLTGGDPTRDLGHASDATTRKHYLDPTLCDDDDGDRLFRPW